VVEETWDILKLLGIDERRLRLKWISASEGSVFAAEIQAFVKLLNELGENPLTTPATWDLPSDSLPNPTDMIKKPVQLTMEQVEYCMECSICTESCPVSRMQPGYSPKQIIKRAVMKLDEDLLRSREIWSCLNCAYCSKRCPAMINFPELNCYYRQEARKAGNLPLESHHGVHQLIARLQTRSIQQQRTAWAAESGNFRTSGEYFYFVGCLPYYDITLSYLNISPLTSARSVLSLLNTFEIEPVISNDERCCGHDALWSGDETTFRQLARWNLEVIKASGAKTVLFSCPEGYHTFKTDYPKYFGELPFTVVYMTEFLSRNLPDEVFLFQPSNADAITFQDPCRLGRWAGIYESPRHLLKRIPETELTEMERNRENALCCGTSCWIECALCSKDIQTERLLEAEQSGAKMLITACPKCQIHLTCAQSGEDINLKLKDIYTYLLEHLRRPL
jgi:Fe-S oxidoreductase